MEGKKRRLLICDRRAWCQLEGLTFVYLLAKIGTEKALGNERRDEVRERADAQQKATTVAVASGRFACGLPVVNNG